jgi:hypothetical protein
MFNVKHQTLHVGIESERDFKVHSDDPKSTDVVLTNGKTDIIVSIPKEVLFPLAVELLKPEIEKEKAERVAASIKEPQIHIYKFVSGL